jgi:hypothetical protein
MIFFSNSAFLTVPWLITFHPAAVLSRDVSLACYDQTLFLFLLASTMALTQRMCIVLKPALFWTCDETTHSTISPDFIDFSI